MLLINSDDINAGEVAVTNELITKIEAGATVYLSVSGGKDSTAVALAVYRFLKANSYRNEVILIHADLGMIEWKDSMVQCEKLADYLQCELVIVKREKGDMIDRWEQRWADNMRRYIDLFLTTTLLPWSTPSMRICTSELKTSIIARYMRQHSAANAINVTGIRRQESTGRSKSLTSTDSPSPFSKGTITWNAIAHWPVESVWREINGAGLPHHEAYLLGNERVSCSFCIMASINDLNVAANADEHQLTLQRLADLEMKSLYAFQGARWLMELRSDRLRPDQQRKIQSTLSQAQARVAIESNFPESARLHGAKGSRPALPKSVPSFSVAEQIADIRNQIFDLYGYADDRTYCTATKVQDRYSERMIDAGLDPVLSNEGVSINRQSEMF